jgi:predicted molibdopterin-dependent oxidoreductase YjgC
MTRRSVGLDAIQPENELQIHPNKAAELGIHDGEKVRVISRRGSIELKARVTDIVDEDVVFTFFHFAEAAANVLTNAAPESLDPVAGIPEYKVSAVRIEKI